MNWQQVKLSDPPRWVEELEPRVFLSAVTKAGPTAVPNFRIFHPAGGVTPTATASPTGITPANLISAYGIDHVSFGGVVGDGTGQTIAIVDAYNAPTLAADLAAFDQVFNLPAPPSLTIIGQDGSSTLPGTDPAGPGNSWAVETSLDVQWAHAVAPNASILVVLANSPSFSNLMAAVDTARNYPGVCVVSMSWAGDEFSNQWIYDSYFTTPGTHSGVTFVAASGDNGAYGANGTTMTVSYPAVSANVLAVGGTYLSLSGGTWVSETGWGHGTSSGTQGGSGGGISKIVRKPSYQSSAIVTQSSKRRCIPDIAMNADPASGVPIIDTWDYGTSTPWAQVGGTSLSAPLWAGLISIVDQGRVLAGRTSLDGPTGTLPAIYNLAAQDFHDITSGNNGYAAAAGYDLVTGRGTPIANLVVSAMVGNTSSAPTVATAASASPNPATGTTTALSVLGADDGGEINLTYAWATTGSPPAGVTFSVNGTNDAKNTLATFTKAGSYSFQVTITDAIGLSVTSSVSVTVNQTLTSIAVSPASVTLNEQQTQQFAATARDQFGTALTSQPAFTWGKASGVGSISATGLYTAPASTGAATITATSGAVSGSASITVTNAAPTVATAAASPNPVPGTTTALSVLGADDGGEANLTYTWATTGSPPALVTFSVNGTNAAKNTIATFTKAGAYSLRATITDAGGLSTTSTVNVTVNQTLTSITVSPASVMLNEQQTQQFAATGYDQFGTALASQPSFTWAMASGVGSISASGLYTAPANTGVATITATSGSASGSASVTVNNAVPTVLAPPTASPNPVSGTTTALSVLGTDDGGQANLTYTWGTIGSPPALVTFSANGTNAARNATATFTTAGNYSFQVTITDAGGLSTTSSVSVTVNQTLTSITVSPASVTLNEQQTQQFAATAYDQFGAVLVGQPPFAWALASGVGSIDASGLYAAPAGTGVATITATSGVVSGSASVTVNNAAPTVSTPATASPNPVADTAITMNVLGDDDGGQSNLTYTWATLGTPPALVSFSDNGTNAAKNATATFTKAGDYSFQVTITDAGGLSTTSSANVTVNQTLTSVTVTPGSVSLTEEQTQQFAATAYDQFGLPLAGQPSFTWAMASGVGGISAAGLYTAPTGAGLATVSATCGAVSGEASIAINALPTIGSFTITPDSVVSGDPIALMAGNVQEAGGTVVAVPFYRETNGIPGLQTDSDTFFGEGASAGADWSLALNAALASGTYTFYALAIDSTDTTVTAEATLTVMPIAVTVNALATNNNSPALTGTVSSRAAAVSVTIAGHTWLALNNGDGTWLLPAGMIAPALTTGFYDVQALASDAYGNVAADATVNELAVYAIPGDVNLDGVVNFLDYNIVKTNYLKTDVGWAGGDLNGDGIVSFLDYNIVKTHYLHAAALASTTTPPRIS